MGRAYSGRGGGKCVEACSRGQVDQGAGYAEKEKCHQTALKKLGGRGKWEENVKRRSQIRHTRNESARKRDTATGGRPCAKTSARK